MSTSATLPTPEIPVGELVLPPQSPRRRYRLLWFQLIPIALLLVVEFVFQLPLAHTQTDSRVVSSYMVGHILGGLLIPLLISWITYRLFRRSELAANVTFAVMILLMILASYSDSRNISQKIARELVAAERERIARIEKDGNEAAERFRLSMGFNDQLAPTTTDRAAKILAAMHRFDEMTVQADALKSAIHAAHARLEGQLKSEGVMVTVRAQALDALDEYIQPQRFEANIAATDQCYRCYRKTLDYLHDHRGQWTIPPAVGRVHFEDPAKQREYDQIIAECEAALDVLRQQQRELQASTRPSPTS